MANAVLPFRAMKNNLHTPNHRTTDCRQKKSLRSFKSFRGSLVANNVTREFYISEKTTQLFKVQDAAIKLNQNGGHLRRYTSSQVLAFPRSALNRTSVETMCSPQGSTYTPPTLYIIPIPTKYNFIYKD